ncbi:MAG: hypothetical protein HONBIEJF_00410 [Fimbriimonadaceae bacterium]|nr:hypothetical protein [Fimbriimonadaceae bacterium]
MTSLAVARVTITADQAVLENSLVRRVVRTHGFVGTISFQRCETGEEFVRTIEPEAKLVIDRREYWLGGVTGLPNKAFLQQDWIAWAEPAPMALRLVDVKQASPQSSVPHGNGWVPEGKACELVFDHDDFTASLHLEIYDHLPAIGKRVVIHAKPGKRITVNQVVVERLSLVEGESEVEANAVWRLPNVTALSDMSFGGSRGTCIHWSPDESYKTQVNYLLKTPCVLEVRPPFGMHQATDGADVRSVTSYVLLHKGTNREENTLEQRRLYRRLAPWVLDNPLMLHVVSNDDQEIRRAIDQASECGFEMVIMSFGSGLNMEDVSPANISRWRTLREYASRKGIRFGGYSLLASRRISDEHDVINPQTGKTGGAIFGNSPCLGSTWGVDYFDRLRTFIEGTGFQMLEHDGNYPGDQCASTTHPGHRGLDDSQWNQYRQITEFYHWCRARGVFLNVPDYYHLNGSNKTGMGYRETNWSLPREQQHVHARQNLFDGTWSKTPSMGWMFVPLVEYHGGGAAATIEPLRDHLKDYELHFANTFGFGAQACWRGTRLYDSPETKALVRRMVDWYKQNRVVLESDIVHLRRADGRRLDYVLHVAESKKHAMLVVYNPTAAVLEEAVTLPLTACGMRGRVAIISPDGKRTVSRPPEVVKVKVPAGSWTWLRFSTE